MSTLTAKNGVVVTGKVILKCANNTYKVQTDQGDICIAHYKDSKLEIGDILRGKLILPYPRLDYYLVDVKRVN